MQIRIHYRVIIFSCFLLVFSGCKKWEEHNAVTDPAAAKTAFEQISANPDLSRFAQLLVSSGYDKVLATSKTYTVFAPTNTALANLGTDITGDTAKLNKFISNHIADLTYSTFSALSGLRVKMLNGKYNNMTAKLVEDANIVKGDIISKNGVVHVIDKMLPYLPSIWEAIQTNPAIPAKQKAYLLSLYVKVFDSANAVQTGVNPLTGAPVYKAGTDSMLTNLYWNNVQNLTDESKQFTFFALNDLSWDAEVNKLKPYFVTSTVDSTTKLVSWELSKDLAFENIYTPSGAAADTITSKFNTRMPVEKASIVQSIKTSNGIIYIMSKMDELPKYKIKPFLVEAENYRFTLADRRGNTYFRDRYNPLTALDFRDVLIFGHGVTGFYTNYRISNVSSVKYRAYWVALNDFQTATFTQKLGIGDPASVILPYTNVVANTYTETLLGEFTQASYRSFLDLYLVANGTGPIACDYIKLVPVFP